MDHQKLSLFVLIGLCAALSIAVTAQVPQTYEDLIYNLHYATTSDFNQGIPDFAKTMLGTNTISVYVPGAATSTEHLWAETRSGNIIGIGIGRILYPTPTMNVEASKEVIETILRSDDKEGALAYAIFRNEIKTSFSLISFSEVANRGSRTVISLSQPDEPPPPQPPPQIYDSSGRPTLCNGYQWQLVNTPIVCSGPFQASGAGYGQNCCESACGAHARCDERRVGASVTGGSCNNVCNFVPLPAGVQKKIAGELCEHGGQCKSGNCVGAGFSPPWTFRCSCDPFKFLGGDC